MSWRTALRRTLEKVRAFIRPQRGPAPAGAPPGDPDQGDPNVRAALLAEIAELNRSLADARNELYGLNVAYSSQHFTLSAALQGKRIEDLRHVGSLAGVRLLRVKCAELESRVQSLRAELRSEGSD